MTLAAIMVHVDLDEDTESRICVAAEIARRFDALLIGAAGWALRKHDGLKLAGVDFPPTGDDRDRQVRTLEQLGQLGEKFRRLAGPNPRGVEWRSSTNFPNDFIAAAARAADLLVIGRDLLPGDEFRTYDPGTIILAAGRPVLVVPRGTRQFQPTRVLIAWKDTREARRAIRDALPFLKEAQSVSIAVANPIGLESADVQIADVVRYLALHGVSVSQQIATVAGENEGHVLLELAGKHHADLIVAGAYGRTRLSEWIFGGVTRDLLLTSTVPCLFSN